MGQPFSSLVLWWKIFPWNQGPFPPPPNPSLPLPSGGTPCVRIEVRGGSFMLHQIRLMIGTAVAVARGFLPLALLPASLEPHCRITVRGRGAALLGDLAARSQLPTPTPRSVFSLLTLSQPPAMPVGAPCPAPHLSALPCCLPQAVAPRPAPHPAALLGQFLAPPGRPHGPFGRGGGGGR